MTQQRVDLDDHPLRRTAGCLARVLALTLLAELAAFKLATLLFVGYDSLQSVAAIVLALGIVVGLALVGLMDETLLVLVLLVLLLFLLPGGGHFVGFYREHLTTLLLHLWIPLYYCKRWPPAAAPKD